MSSTRRHLEWETARESLSVRKAAAREVTRWSWCEGTDRGFWCAANFRSAYCTERGCAYQRCKYYETQKYRGDKKAHD